MDIDPSSGTCVSDAFMLNLGAVMLRMCRPFCKDYRDGKVLRVDPTYGAVEVCNLSITNSNALRF